MPPHVSHTVYGYACSTVRGAPGRHRDGRWCRVWLANAPNRHQHRHSFNRTRIRDYIHALLLVSQGSGRCQCYHREQKCSWGNDPKNLAGGNSQVATKGCPPFSNPAGTLTLLTRETRVRARYGSVSGLPAGGLAWPCVPAPSSVWVGCCCYCCQ